MLESKDLKVSQECLDLKDRTDQTVTRARMVRLEAMEKLAQTDLLEIRWVIVHHVIPGIQHSYNLNGLSHGHSTYTCMHNIHIT